MNSERNIVNKLFEGKYKELEEAGFDAKGSHYSCAFGRYTKDGEPISREEYFKAKGEDVKGSDTPAPKKGKSGNGGSGGGNKGIDKDSGVREVTKSDRMEYEIPDFPDGSTPYVSNYRVGGEFVDIICSGSLGDRDKASISIIHLKSDEGPSAEYSIELPYDKAECISKMNDLSAKFKNSKDLSKDIESISKDAGLRKSYEDPGYSSEAKKSNKHPKMPEGETINDYDWVDWSSSDDSTWDDETYEIQASLFGAAKALGTDVKNIRSVTEDTDGYDDFIEYLEDNEDSIEKLRVDTGYSNISTYLCTDKKTGSKFTMSDNHMGFVTYEYAE